MCVMRYQEAWDVRDPASIISEVMGRGSPRCGDVVVAMLDRGDSTEAPHQRLLDLVRVHQETDPLPDRYDASELLREHALKLAGDRPFVDGRWMPPAHLLITVQFRSGRVIPGPDEYFWLMAWRYSNHNSMALDGDVYLVTEHGWTGCRDHRAGFSPALGSGGGTHLSVVA